MSTEETVSDEFDRYQEELLKAQTQKSNLEKFLEVLKSWLVLAAENGATSQVTELEIKRSKAFADLEEARARLNSAYSEPDRRSMIAETGNEIQKLERDRSDLLRELNRLDAWIEMKLESIGKFDLSFLNNRRVELSANIENAQKQNAETNLQIASAGEKIKNLQAKRADIAERIKAVNLELRSMASRGDNEIVREVNSRLENSLSKLETAQSENDLDRIRKVLDEIKTELKQL